MGLAITIILLLIFFGGIFLYYKSKKKAQHETIGIVKRSFFLPKEKDDVLIQAVSEAGLKDFVGLLNASFTILILIIKEIKQGKTIMIMDEIGVAEKELDLEKLLPGLFDQDGNDGDDYWPDSSEIFFHR